MTAGWHVLQVLLPLTACPCCHQRPHVCLTKLVGTVGGNSRSPEVLASLIEAGMTGNSVSVTR